ncbi:MAG: tryptophan synthase subunit alpha [Kiritimatiellia bacterium]
MNRLTKTFQRLSQQRRRALVGYLTAGDPDFDTSLAILQEGVKAGLDVLELGVPFSDPTADGPVIQLASARAIQSGMTVARVLELARRVRAAQADVPIVLFSYYNPLLHFGLERLAKEATAAGVDGLLIVDLPPEEADELQPAMAGHDLPLIRLVAPTTSTERMTAIVQNAGGFIYLITRTGVTGAGTLDRQRIQQLAADLRALTPLPVCLGFGISTAADVRQLAGLADGVVVGSALVKIVAEHGADKRTAMLVADKVRELRTALDAIL